jgi:benzoyl-CoA reductase/2-hydroxyglutaryl-CoA dehydratase subunit BcrC/BadD/HgdB
MSNDKEMWKKLGLDVELHQEILDSIEKKFEEQVLSQKNRPANMIYFDMVIKNAHGARVQEIIDRKNNGAKFIGTFCIYVPEEIVLALDAIPVALCGGTSLSIPYAEKTFPRNICPLVKSTLGLSFSRTCPYAPIKDMAVGETTCDAKKKTWDVLSKKVNFHVMEVPQKKEAKDKELWHEEVFKFKNRLEELAGKKLESEKLSKTIQLMNRKRRAIANLHSLRKGRMLPISGMDSLVIMQAALNDEPERFCQKLEQLNEELGRRIKNGASIADKKAKRIMISGCPSVMGNWKTHHLIESAGAVIVCDETCTGTRYFENLVTEGNGNLAHQLKAISDRYLEISCSCFSPNEERMSNVLRLAKEYQVDGVVQYILQYCHTYNVEAINIASALKKEGIPNIKIETDYSEEDVGQLKTRLEAFFEGIESKNAKR